MSYIRRTANPGKREREARKRHRRARCWRIGSPDGGLKLGRTHLRRWWLADLAVADSRNAARGGGVMSPSAEAPQPSPMPVSGGNEGED